MSLEVGSRLAHYDVTALIGEGGMGQVYQATDTKLNRQVALKILPEAFAADPDRLARFQREAQVLASLNHPGIAAIYGIEEQDGTRALVLELVEGPTLADRISKGPIPVDEVLPIAKQIAEALEAAHEAGVIHRDLKPANIKVREDGTVKVLDFGLAKALDPNPTTDPSESPTLTAAATQMGVIMGTAAYMSPEQARGKPVDKRADIWSFGVVLYEMLTGQRAFQGEDVSLTLASVMKSDLNVATLPHDVPANVRIVLRRCLEKDANQRIRDIGDVRLAMEGAFEAPITVVVPEAQPVSWQRPLVVAVAVLAVVGVITGVLLWTVPRPAQGSLARFVISAGGRQPLFVANNSGDVTISPDGQDVAHFAATGNAETAQIQVRRLDQLVPTTLVTEGQPFNAFFSPDSEWLGFYDLADRMLKRVSVHGGPTLEICDLPGEAQMRGATWGPDDTIVFGTSGADNGLGLWRVHAEGGEPERITTPDERGRHWWPEMLPSGEAVLFTMMPRSGVENAQLAVVSSDGGEPTLLSLGGSYPRYVPTGHLVYGVGGILRAVRFDPDRLEVTGDPIPVMDGVTMKRSGSASFGVAQDGSLVYMPGVFGTRAGVQRTLAWVDRQGREEPVGAEPGVYTAARVSPDATAVAVAVGAGVGNENIGIYDLLAENLRLLTTTGILNQVPIWTPDSRRVIYRRRAVRASLNLFWQAADATGQEERLTTSANPQTPHDVTSDGTQLIFTENRPETAVDIGLLSLTDKEDMSWLLNSPSAESNPALSPDDRWIAYASDRSGVIEVYVRPFPDSRQGPETLVSQGGGNWPAWAPEGDELFYLAPQGMMAVAVEREPRFRVGTRELVFGVAGIYTAAERTYDINPDDRRFLVIKEGAGADTALPQIILVLNWADELQRLVPVD